MALPPDDRRCTGTAKSTGQRCKRRAIPGGTVCVKHGGGAPQVRKAAAKRLLRERLDGELAPFLEDLEVPVDEVDPVSTLLRAVGRSEALVDLWSAKAGQLSTTTGAGGRGGGMTLRNHFDDERVSVVLTELRASLETVARIARSAIDADLGERVVQLQEAEVELLREVVLDALEFAKIGALNALGAAGAGRDVRERVAKVIEVEARERVATSIRASVAGEDRPPLPELEASKPEPARPEPQSPARLSLVNDDDQEDQP